MRAALLVLLLSGCSVLKPVTDNTRYYVLNDLPAKTPQMLGAPSIGLEPVQLPEYLNRSELVARLGSNELKIYDSHRWGEPIKEGIERTLRRDLAVLLGAERVDEPPWAEGPPSMVIEIELRRFERVGDDQVELDATWVLRDGKSGKTLVARSTHATEKVDGKGAQATVDALSRALASLSKEIANTVRGRR
jgi:uncharacterized protein